MHDIVIAEARPWRAPPRWMVMTGGRVVVKDGISLLDPLQATS